jgi:hypothetical protein
MADVDRGRSMHPPRARPCASVVAVIATQNSIVNRFI